MLALLQDTPPGTALFIIAAIIGLIVGCRALVTYGLGRAVIRASRPEDLPKTLRAVREVVDAATRLTR